MKFMIDVEKVPDGYKPVAFRVPQKGDLFLSDEGETVLERRSLVVKGASPHLILEKEYIAPQLLYWCRPNGEYPYGIGTGGSNFESPDRLTTLEPIGKISGWDIMIGTWLNEGIPTALPVTNVVLGKYNDGLKDAQEYPNF